MTRKKKAVVQKVTIGEKSSTKEHWGKVGLKGNKKENSTRNHEW